MSPRTLQSVSSPPKNYQPFTGSIVADSQAESSNKAATNMGSVVTYMKDLDRIQEQQLVYTHKIAKEKQRSENLDMQIRVFILLFWFWFTQI